MLQRDPQIALLLPETWLPTFWRCRGEVKRDQHPPAFNGTYLMKSIGSDNHLKMLCAEWGCAFNYICKSSLETQF